MEGKARSNEDPSISSASRSLSTQAPSNSAMAFRPSREEDWDMNVALGMALRPAARAMPGSKTRSITWLRRDLPRSLRSRAARTACSAGIIFVPGKPHRATMASRSNRARNGRSMNTPPTWVENSPSGSENIRTSATASAIGRGRLGRSSSRRRGGRGKPPPRTPAWRGGGGRGVREAAPRSRGGGRLDEVGTEGLVLSLAGGDRLKEEAGFLRYRMPSSACKKKKKKKRKQTRSNLYMCAD